MGTRQRNGEHSDGSVVTQDVPQILTRSWIVAMGAPGEDDRRIDPVLFESACYAEALAKASELDAHVYVAFDEDVTVNCLPACGGCTLHCGPLLPKASKKGSMTEEKLRDQLIACAYASVTVTNPDITLAMVIAEVDKIMASRKRIEDELVRLAAQRVVEKTLGLTPTPAQPAISHDHDQHRADDDGMGHAF